MKKKILNYWDKFYLKKHILKPSPFAKYVLSKYKKKLQKVYEIGCGNGRDAIFFNKKKINFIGIDKSKNIIKKNKLNFSKFNTKFICGDFCNFFKKKISETFCVYSRFTWHSINYKQEKKLLNYLNKQKKLDYLFIETRTINDELYNQGKKIGEHEFITTHYRRFIDSKILKKKLLKNFKIIYFKEGKNLAKFKNENPCVLRLIAKKI